MGRKLVILCIPMSALGHINPSVGLCLPLLSNGHKVVFAVERGWKGKLQKYGFEEEVYDEREIKEEEQDGKFWSDFFNRISHYFRGNYEQRTNVLKISMDEFFDQIKYSNKRIGEIIKTVMPDVIIQDRFLAYPSIVKCGVPFVTFWPSNPLMALECPNLPPFDTSEPLSDSSNWSHLREIRHKIMASTWSTVNEWMISEGLPQLQPHVFHYDSEHLNILLYPKALFQDYATRISLKENWVLVDHVIRDTNDSLDLPAEFVTRPGKVVYLSMGSMASSDVNLMARLISILANSKHKFVVSLGDNHEKYELAENMWGMARVPQLEVLKISDLFITHGGNNSFIEGLYFGVPMIVMPLFDDQYANAQRIVESSLGTKMNPFTVVENELLTTIETLFNDTNLHKRLSVVSKQLQESTSLNDVVRRIESIAGQ